MSEKSENPYLALSGFSTLSGLISVIRSGLTKPYQAYQAIYGRGDLIRPILVFGFFRQMAMPIASNISKIHIRTSLGVG
jgi:hypothetical protein